MYYYHCILAEGLFLSFLLVLFLLYGDPALHITWDSESGDGVTVF